MSVIAYSSRPRSAVVSFMLSLHAVKGEAVLCEPWMAELIGIAMHRRWREWS